MAPLVADMLRILREKAPNGIPFAELVLNPDENTGFAQTIENMDALSQLIHQGLVSVSKNAELGLWITPVNQQHHTQGDTIVVPRQFIVSFDFNTWKSLKDIVTQGTTLMPHRTT
jgi:hypothetical protein